MRLASPRILLALVAAVVVVAMPGVAAGQSTRGGPLSGTWSGYIASGAKRQHIMIVVNARETAGSWKLSATCQGSLSLESISNGYHHFVRKVARGSSCAGGDVDCLKPAGANVYDAVTSHLGGEYDSGGTLHRVRSRPAAHDA